MKTPIKYYGGKQRLVPWISRYIPPHKTYVEPFAGGLALFFGRPKIKGMTEVINDKNSMVANFWKQLRDNNKELHQRLDNTMYSSEDFNHCRDVYRGKTQANDLEKARAFFVVFNCSFAAIGSGWARGLADSRMEGHKIEHVTSKIKSILFLKNKMTNVYIENTDALKVINAWDGVQSFFYCDPPYPETCQGSYSGYTMGDFNKLTNVLKNIKGKFILSCYLKEGMDIESSWRIVKKRVLCHSEGISNGGNRAEREECLIMNY